MELITKPDSALVQAPLRAINKVISFYLGEHLFGVDILTVKEVTPLMEITPVYHAPTEVRGYLNLRGEIHLVLDLRFMMGLGAQAQLDKEMVIIFKNQVAPPFGIIVDSIGEVIEFEANHLEYNTHGEEAGKNKLILGVLKQEHALMTLLDAYRFLN